MIKIASVFSGIGGFEKGFQQVDPTIEIVFSSEIDKYARQIYKKNFGVEPHGDIREINATDVPDHDILCAGFPCQSFSIAGKRRGFEDIRGTLFFEIMRIAKSKRPKLLFLENVRGLLSHDDGRTIEVMCKSLNRLGYIVNMDIYNSKHYGVPQNRERVFLICTHIREIINAGLNQKMTISETIIQECLFQILLNNLEGVAKQPERESKDLILGLLILNEIQKETGLNMKFGFSSRTKHYLSKNFPTFFQAEDILQSTLNQFSSELKEKRKRGIILTVADENKSTLSTELVWQSIDMLLKQNFIENYQGSSKYTISTAIKQIIESKTFLCSQMFLAILLATVQLRNSSKFLWKRVLSNLTVVQENMRYDRINQIAENEIVTESNNHYTCEDANRLTERVFIIRHSRNRSTRQIFPIHEIKEAVPETRDGGCICAGTLSTRNQSGQAQWDGSTTLICDSGQARTDQLRHDVIPPLRANTGAGSNNLVTKCLSGGGHSGGNHSDMTVLHTTHGVRRLTPTECERLQGFVDGWTEGISDTQRYKCLGNAVTVNVVEFIARHIIEMLHHTTDQQSQNEASDPGTIEKSPPL